jgi:RimJ/RimL family protein N-acetyltransferase
MKVFDKQPALESKLIKLQPLKADDFDVLYAVASDPLIWEQHPNPDRYKREVFQNFFKGAMESGAAFLVLDRQSGNVIGSSRYYDLKECESSVAIGYTFLDRDHWGGSYNGALKKLMLEHAFQYVNRVLFHIGAENIRSQKSMERLGGKKIKELKMEYYGEQSKLNFEYEMKKENWNQHLKS